MPPKVSEVPPSMTTRSSNRASHQRRPKGKAPAAEPTLGEMSTATLRPEEQPLPTSDDNASVASTQSRRSSHHSSRNRQNTPDTTRELLNLVQTLQLRINSLEEENRPGNRPRRSTPFEDRRPIRIPDPERLNDGQTEGPTYESWISALKDKLDHDVFAGGEKEKMAYLFNRTTGKAQAQLEPLYDRSLPEKERYQTVEAMVADLTAAFVDPFKKRNAVHQYHRLQMRPTQNFREFYQEFRKLAALGSIHQDARQIDLFEKLHYELKMLVAPTLGIHITVNALADQCLLMDQNLHRIQATRNQELRRRIQTTTPAEQLAPQRRAPLVEAKKSEYLPKPYVPMSQPPVESPKPFKCFNCGKDGHGIKECPEPRRAGLHEVDGYDGMELEEEPTEYESGKEEA